MTSPTLPTFIPTARRTYAFTQHRKKRSIKRAAFLDSLLLFIFFTTFFAIITVAAFS